MKKKTLGLSILVGSAMLTGCIDPSNDNSSILQNNLVFDYFDDGLDFAVSVGINQSNISGFENKNGTNPTQVTVTYSNISSGCTAYAADGMTVVTTTATTASTDTDVGELGFDSFLGGIVCDAAGKTANLTISFTASGKNYTAATTLTS
ncbi:hypothetical protein LO80_06805 [Candidatus Francisella endociliophora]|uniref:Lipoprotein n=1 Tax=Candidatus Francisella endociliophora TaxID=653937 RepID=A0A097EQ57_9GAMM|nr:hypothetical protein [Francisella sp. FSC1006]AIT09700.1 hypothetical protein LO80_06805 [Francisella sp. FSC1006]